MYKEDKPIDIILGEYDSGKMNKVSLRRYLRRMTDQQIIAAVGMAEMSKIIWLLETKYKRKAQVIPIEKDVMLRVDDTNVANMSFQAVTLHFLTVKNQVIHIEGNISVPAGINKPYKFYAKVNGNKIEVKPQDCGLDLKLGNEVYEIRTAFSLSVPLMKQWYIIEFFNLIDGIECSYSRINSMRFAPVSDSIKGQYYAMDDWIVQISGNQIVCHMSDVKEIAEYEENYQNELRNLQNESAGWAIELRKKYFELVKQKIKPMWLIMDRSNRADDNGEIFFKYMQQHREVDTYFVIDEQSKDYKRLQTFGRVIPLYSEKHYLLALLADCVISSQCNGCVENPFWENAEYFRDIYHKPQLIFLQHGVIKDDMSPTLNRFHTNLRGFVTSTKAEYQSLLEYPYYFNEESIWLTGLPVLDELKNNEQRYIVIAPTWRKDLMYQQWDEERHEMIWVPKGDIKASAYYRKYQELIRDPILKKYCQKNDYKLAFKPHPLMERYIIDIVDGTDVQLMGEDTSYRDMLSMGSLMVTDYSSVAFEFAYLGKSVLYYQFDRKSFFAAHTYRKGYFDYVRDGFGEVCKRKGELIRYLISYMENGCVVKDKYKRRIRQLYSFHGGACERLYEHIRQVTIG
ncbi:MAG: CDP-glycerol glycerophosphotransferase family protein [Lachnospiraceae bacterium]|nr:CDP-glycerol glycerophosphotransferase family protein [Lachnospiraceae bacterium]